MGTIKSLKDLEKIKNKYKADIENRSVGAKTDMKYVLVCSETGCISSGSKKIYDKFNDLVQQYSLENKIKIIKTGCIGVCELGPVAIVYPDGILYTKLKQEDVQKIVIEHFQKGEIQEQFIYKHPKTGHPIRSIDEIPFFKQQEKIVRRNSGIIDPENIDEYIANNGYSALERVLTKQKPQDVINDIKKSGLRGRGGGGFPTGLKWEFTSKENGNKKYVICNADEGDPGAFMDRSQLEGDPHSLIEGMTIAAYAIGADFGYIYCRAEYPLAIDRIEKAIKQARNYKLLGENIFDSDFNFDLEVRMGAGAFVCGEETALIASIEGKRGEPRPKPPFPSQKGVWNKPSIVNNVETYSNVASLLNKGVDNYLKIGTETSRGTKVFALAGAIKNVGLIEVPMGMTLGEVVFDIGGGIIDDKEFKAAQIGGPSGGCIPKKLLNTPIDYESLKQAGAMMGSGGLIVMNDDTCMVDLAKFFLEFIQEESCGKCPPCRIGTKRMLDILNRISEGKGKPGDIEELISLGEDIKASAICGLGQTAPNPVLSTIKNFREEYEAHIYEKFCPAGVCAELVYAPCQNACPAGVNIPSFVALTGAGRYEEALKIHLEKNPFPLACGLTCTHPCETKCRRSTLDAPLAIREIKRFMANQGGSEGIYKMPEPIKRPSIEKKKIGIIGGGPAGLTCAYFLRRLGHNVTIYEGQEKLGGMLRYGIPEYRYPKKLLDNEIKNILDMGISVHTSTQVGKDITYDELKNKYDAIVLAIGGWESRKLGMKNEDADGVIGGKDFLWKIAHKDIDNVDGDVVVIGGGNTAIDVARSALRLGANSVTLAYRRSIDQMPAEQEEINELIEEGIYPEELHNIEEIVTKNGKVTGIKCRRQKLGKFDYSGRKRPEPLEGEENSIIFKCNVLIPAISQQIDLEFAPKIEKNKNGTVKIDKYTFKTSEDNIFACGDVVEITNLAIAIGQGERTAVEVERSLNPGIIDKFSWRELKSPDVDFDPDEEPIETPRVETEYSSVEERIKNFLLVNRGVNWEDKLRKEARRCLRCDYKEECEE